MIPKRKLEFLLDKVKRTCGKCGGQGCLQCRSKIARYSMYARVGIPVDYWSLSFKNFSGDQSFKELIHERILDIDGMYDSGKSLAFVGSLGTGKTYMASCILKKALVEGFSGKYTTMADIIRQNLSNTESSNKYVDDLFEVDFLIIDEFDIRHIFPSEKAEKLFGETLEYILRSRFQNQLPTILCSNTPDIDKVLSEDFSKAFSSLRSKYVDVFYVLGKDYRRSGN